MQVFNSIKGKTRTLLASYAKKTFHFNCKSFPTIISNDCFGGELYRCLNVQYNTPFIGLMIMAPCYIKLLKNLSFYLSQPLVFKKESKYNDINELRKNKGYFPIACLDDVEIQFLHYKNDEEARQKWEKRKLRMDLGNLFIKYDYSKDYSTDDLLQEFLQLKHPKKLAIGSGSVVIKTTGDSIVNLPEYAKDATVLFRISLRYIDYASLLNESLLRKPAKVKGYILSKWLQPAWLDKSPH